MKKLLLILLCLTMIACGVNALIKKEYTYDKRFVKGEGYYNKEGKKEGIWKEYRFNDNGVFRKEFEALYGNGERMTFIGSYLNSEKEGIWKEFYESDQLFQKGNFTEGEKHGEWLYYYKNGKLSQKGNYKGVRIAGIDIIGNERKYPIMDGLWEFYSRDGKLVKKDMYRDGKLYEISIVPEKANKKGVLKNY